MAQEIESKHPVANRLSARPESEIIADWKSNRDTPLVSVCCATYNHVQYIEDAICGFLAQKTDFPFEVIIRDDASDDGTTEIVLEYASRYPAIVKAVINVENEYRKGIRPSHVWPKIASGEYLAICEGDDFWIAPDKLQRQVALLEQHQNAVMAVALTHFFEQNGRELKYVRSTVPTASELIEFEELEKHYFHTSTYLIRAGLFRAIMDKQLGGPTRFGDTALRSVLITYGPFAILPKVVSVYRMTGSGVWSSLDQVKRLSWEYEVACNLSALLKGKYKRSQRRKLYGISRSLCLSSIRSGAWFDGVKWGGRTLCYGAEEAMRRVVKHGHHFLRRPQS